MPCGRLTLACSHVVVNIAFTYNQANSDSYLTLRHSYNIIFLL
jgi:hypothetical protein